MWPRIEQSLKEWQSALIVAPLVSGFIVVGSNAGLFRILEWATLDQFFRLRAEEPVDKRIAIVTIDESDIEYVRQWPMSDRVMARLIRNIKAQNPRAVAIDIYRDLPVEPGHSELVQIFESTPNLIGIQKIAGNPVNPPPILKERGQVAANDLLIDSDSKIRRGIVLLGTPDGELIQGLGVKLAMEYLSHEGIELEAIDASRQIYSLGRAKFVPLSENDGEYSKKDMGGYQILLNYRGGLDRFLHISLKDVLENQIPDGLMSDRLVFIGAKAPSLNDNFLTPYNSTLLKTAESIPGVVIHANLTSQVIGAALESRPMLRATTKPINWLWIFIWSSYSAALGRFFIRRSWLTGAGILLAGGAIVATSYIAFSLGWLIPIFTPLVALGSAAVISIGLVLWQNLMLSYHKLEDYAHTLEDKVRERTAELAQANEEISILNEQLKEENLRMGAELDVARQLQQMVLPKHEELEAIEGIDISGYMDPADEVGGDYYDVLYADGLVTIGIGDVTGHGLESGILMLMVQTSVRTLKEVKETDPVRFLDAINRTIFKNVWRMGSERNLTLAILNYSDGNLSVSGQHEETLVIREGGHIERIDTMDLGLPIGMDDDIADFIDHVSIELQTGDGVVLYTDGIPEAYNPDKKQYGMDRLCAVISQSWQESAKDIKQAIIDDVTAFIGKQKVFDDITLLVFKKK